MLTTSDYVHVFAFDFSKAFDTVRHHTLMTKMASLELPDNIYNWIYDFFRDRQHCTRYAGQSSSVAAITASIIQGSGLDPASYIITAADLHPVTNGNRIVKFADDTYLVIPAFNSSSRLLEIDHIQTWAAGNNLMLNCSKSKEIMFTARGKRGKSVQLPSPRLDIERVSSLRVLVVIVNDQRLQRPTTCPTYWHHAAVCYTRYVSCAIMASQSLRYMMSFALPSSRS